MQASRRNRIPAEALTPFVRGLIFPEDPRWHNGALWCSDIADGKVLRITAGGEVDVIADGLLRPSGLGWLPEGQLLVVAGRDASIAAPGGRPLGSSR